MDELTVIGVENGALVVVSGDGVRFRVPITEALHTALRQNRPASPAAHRVGPREIQSLIRSGLTAEQVSKNTGEPVDYIRRFEGPVLAEREYVISTARSVAVAIAGDDEVQGVFGDVIDARLSELGARNMRWESRKKGPHWNVSVSFVDKEVERSAVWKFDPKTSLLVPSNHEAESLSQQGQPPASLLPRLRAVPTDESAARRFDSGAFAPTFDEQRPSPTEPPPARGGRPDTADTEDVDHTGDLLDALRRRRGEREAAPSDDRDSARAAHPSTGSIRIIDVPLDSNSHGHPAPRDAEDDDLSDETPNPVNAPRKPASRRKRATMPSWDDIVFGARPEDDPA